MRAFRQFFRNPFVVSLSNHERIQVKDCLERVQTRVRHEWIHVNREVSA